MHTLFLASLFTFFLFRDEHEEEAVMSVQIDAEIMSTSQRREIWEGKEKKKYWKKILNDQLALKCAHESWKFLVEKLKT